MQARTQSGLRAGRVPGAPAPTCRDDTCFWLYSSGSTGTPKRTIHLHSSLMQTAELYARPVLGIRDNDIVFSAAKFNWKLRRWQHVFA